MPALVLLLTAGAANASETITYSYDAQGRLIGASHSGSGGNTGLDITYQYDLAGNRTANAITGSKNKGQEVVVIPINGFMAIPINP